MLAEPHRGWRGAAGRHRQPQLRQSRAARDHGRAGRRHQRHFGGLPRPRLPGRVRQRLALQRDQRRRRSRRRRRSAASVFSTISRGWRPSPSRPRAKRSSLPARRPPGGRISASRSISARSSAARTARRRRSISPTRSASAISSAASSARAGSRPSTTCSDGGLAVALAEMAMASGIGATTTAPNDGRPAEVFFGEDQGRYCITARREDVDASRQGEPQPVSSCPGSAPRADQDLKLGEQRFPYLLQSLREAHENWFPAFMAAPSERRQVKARRRPWR